MAIQVKNGKAFEWAVAKTISEITKFKIAESPEADLNQNHYLNLDEKKRTVFDESSLIAIDHILKKESKKLKGSGTITSSQGFKQLNKAIINASLAPAVIIISSGFKLILYFL